MLIHKLSRYFSLLMATQILVVGHTPLTDLEREHLGCKEPVVAVLNT